MLLVLLLLLLKKIKCQNGVIDSIVSRLLHYLNFKQTMVVMLLIFNPCVDHAIIFYDNDYKVDEAMSISLDINIPCHIACGAFYFSILLFLLSCFHTRHELALS